MVQDPVNAMQNPTDVYVDHSIPIVNTAHAEGRNRHDARIVDQHVNPAKPLHCQGSERLKIFQPCHVGGSPDSIWTELLDKGLRRAGRTPANTALRPRFERSKAVRLPTPLATPGIHHHFSHDILHLDHPYS